MPAELTSDEADAEDLVQEAYAKVLGVADWRRLEAPERFVMTIIRNLAFERFRRAKVVGIRQIGVLEMEALPDPAPDAHVTPAPARSWTGAGGAGPPARPVPKSPHLAKNARPFARADSG
jgi:DNA-directed RNA polymerase specialized sigma24 family protein